MTDFFRSIGYLIIGGALLSRGIGFTHWEFYVIVGMVTLMLYGERLIAFFAARGR